MTPAVQYLNNFWLPQLGDRVRILDHVGALTAFDPKYREQVRVSDSPEIHYIQDLEWEPTLEDGNRLLARFQVEFLGGEKIQWLGTIAKEPTSLEDVVETLKTFRTLGQLKTGRDLIWERYLELVAAESAPLST